jgi:hypothetical protein
MQSAFVSAPDCSEAEYRECRLPGDIIVDRPGFKFFFPITTMLIVSAVVPLILWLLRK